VEDCDLEKKPKVVLANEESQDLCIKKQLKGSGEGKKKEKIKM
jgi:hypothetical protein